MSYVVSATVTSRWGLQFETAVCKGTGFYWPEAMCNSLFAAGITLVNGIERRGVQPDRVEVTLVAEAALVDGELLFNVPDLSRTVTRMLDMCRFIVAEPEALKEVPHGA